ncbi:periplasmic chaperone for outer membrane proteins SurA [Nitrosospira sp. Nsp5]|uniref:Chaperone SurA n=1 Tax=Nitrosospira multiformis TaxID=1231 RepID=A0ABY0T9D1_9PROT|nr:MULTISPECIES: peptidylprolyl isomerase [Nitrosospira]PTR08047.1 periplasmic chaperone for outer membrane proteins SurA [Nitrosospira sp. Nsp5]SDQ47621.1 periplasmic chaperone for outer membrane proteins SurA [Nitrosospira multiformis]
MGTKFLLRPPVLLAMFTAGIAIAQQPAYSSGIQSIDHIVAVVNENVITRNELDEMLKTAVKQLEKQGMQAPSRAVMEKQMLERIIVNRVQLQLAKETGLTVSDTELDQTIRRIAQENKLSLSEFHSALEEDGISFNKFRNEIRDEIILVRLKEREVNNRISVTEGEVDNFLHTQENSADSSEYRIAHILIQLPEQADAIKIEAMRQRAEAALAQLKDGVEFAKVAAEFSDASDAMQGGLLDWRPASQLTKRFADYVTPMKPGELSSIIQSPNGFHILKLVDRRNQNEAITMVDQTHARHILVKINELTSEGDARRRITDLKERLDNGGKFDELAKLHSEDASAASGGDLGWVSPGDTVPEFEHAMSALKDGEISGPVQSPFGWHLIQVIERRSQDMSKERQRQTARQAIRARKADSAFQDWLQRLRDRAYVEYRLEEG